ncbi:MAG: hypothetical protein AAF329_20765, partial [Cyanobacteria bacterium P01_A01_bin.17]
MLNISEFVKGEFTNLDARELLPTSVAALIGIGTDAVEALALIGVVSIFDLATSRVFNTAKKIADTTNDSDNVFAKYGFAPTDTVDLQATEKTIEELQFSDIGLLKSVDNNSREQLVKAIHLESIRDFSYWSPFRAAQQILNAAFGLEQFSDDPDAPEELLPTAGNYAVEKAFYSQIFLDTIDADSSPPKILEEQVDLLHSDSEQGFTKPAVGAVLTFDQSWYPQGVSLGELLHSVALAPAESTKIAIIDWSRRTSTDVNEGINQIESLSNSLSQNRALEDTVNAVTTEAQNGFSEVNSRSNSSTWGASGGGSFLGFGASASGGRSGTTTEATSVSSSRGRRQISASAIQNINDSTQQNAASVRSRRAAIVREVAQSESEKLQTRTVTNYNHSHALSIHYYEVVQMYRVTTRLSKCERCIFIPMKLLDFTSEQIITKYRKTLLEGALDKYTRDLIGASTRSIFVKN